MPLVAASEIGEGQTESFVKSKRDVEFWTRAFSNSLTRSLLEYSTKKGDSPVEVDEKWNGGYPEYCSLDLEQEFGCHLHPTLNISRVR